MNKDCLFVDVFTDKPYTGNQLAVFPRGEGLSKPRMQALAREINYSETTFILADEERDGGFDVRIFTPEEELPFAGHPTLGTAFAIQQEILKSPAEKIVLNLKVGQIPVTFEYEENEPGVLWMKQKPPVAESPGTGNHPLVNSHWLTFNVERPTSNVEPA